MARINEDTPRLFLAYVNGTIMLCDLVQEHADRSIVRPLDSKRAITVMLDAKSHKTFSKIAQAIAWIESKQPKVKPVTPIKEDSLVYRRRLREMQEKYSPRMVNCSACNSPRHHSYKCQYCGSE